MHDEYEHYHKPYQAHFATLALYCLQLAIYSPVSLSLSFYFLYTTANTDVDGANAQGYDTGIGGSTSTIVSPLGSPQPQLRSHAQRNAALARHMQVSAYFKILRYFVHKDAQIQRDTQIQRYKWVSECLRLRVYLNDYLIMPVHRNENGNGNGNGETCVEFFSSFMKKRRIKRRKEKTL